MLVYKLLDLKMQELLEKSQESREFYKNQSVSSLDNYDVQDYQYLTNYKTKTKATNANRRGKDSPYPIPYDPRSNFSTNFL